MTDENSEVVWKADHTPFGTALVSVDDVDNNLRFPGQYFDEETGLHYNFFRDYDPNTGRYIESDPIGLAGGLKGYIYVFSNSLRFFDKFGLESILDGSFAANGVQSDTVLVGFMGAGGSFMLGAFGGSLATGLEADSNGNICLTVLQCGRGGLGIGGALAVTGGLGVTQKPICEGEERTASLFLEGGMGPVLGGAAGGIATDQEMTEVIGAQNAVAFDLGVGAVAAAGLEACRVIRITCF